MVITRLKRIKSNGVFHDFTWPSDLPDFARYNLIYGWNGSGKTTISRIFRAMELRIPPQGEVTLVVEGRDISSTDFVNSKIPIRVFNRDFMEDSVFPMGGGDVPLILVVGKESVEKQKQVEKLREDLKVAETSLAEANNKKQGANRKLDSFCIDKARVIKDTLRSAGSNKYNNYDKSNFSTRVKQMISDGDASSYALDESELTKASSQHSATRKDRIFEITYRLPALDPIVSAVSDLLQMTVVSQAIQSLKEDPVLAEWTRQGLELHRDRNVDRCLFCEQPLPGGRLSAIEAHFSAEYDRFLHRLGEQTDALQAASRQISELNVPNKAELYDDLAAEYESARNALQQTRASVKRLLDALIIALQNKKSRPFDSLNLDIPAPEVELQCVERLNASIRQHNDACDEFDKRCSDARDRLALDLIASYDGEYAQIEKDVIQNTTNATSADTKVNESAAEIDRIEKEIVEHRRPAAELNEDLLKYLGHGELRLEVNDTGYNIVRNGVTARSLSEGEMTAIALLYFLKSLQDRRFDLQAGLIVLDDPVSSLDANSLYLAFGFIRERTNEAQQLIILTHNFTFFRQVRNWYLHLKNQNKKDISLRPARFYMVECARETDARQATIRPLDLLLERYDSEYHYLFDRIHRAASSTCTSCLAESYTLVNMARRLLEGFLAFRQPHVSGQLWQKLQSIKFDEAKKIRIIRFLHTYSHNSAIGDPEHDPSELSEAHAILSDLLAMMRSVDAEHYLAMEEVLKQTSEETNGG